MRRPSPGGLGFLAGILAIFAVREARAQAAFSRPEAFNLQLFEPAPSSRALFTLDLATVAPHLSLTASLWANYATPVLRAQRGGATVDVVRGAVQTEAQVALGLFQYLEVGLALPVVAQSVVRFDAAGAAGSPDGVAGLGDLRAYAKVPLLRGRTALALRVGVSFPTGDDRAYAGAAYWTLSPALALSHAAGRLTLAANVGAHLQESHEAVALATNDELTLGVGAQYDVSARFAVLAEAIMRVTLNPPDQQDRQVPAEVFAGARVGLAESLGLFAGVGKGLTDAYGSSGFRAFLGLRFTVDRRPCAYGPEDYDGYQDGDFCADPDNDNDGVPDERDRCPNDAEDLDGVLDDDGCADPDNDGDGVLDDADRCPIEPEDHDRFQNEDGCPDLDNDGDRIPDIADACPDEPEDPDGYQDEDGCPEPGPDAAVVTRGDSRLLVSQRIYFDYDSDTIRAVSFPILDEVASTLRRNPDITRLRVEGHTDAAGTPEYNLDLSFRRARAVVDYLAAHGVEARRLDFQGYGQTRPVAQLASSDGDSLNRRVEFEIVEQGAGASRPAAPATPAPAPPAHGRRRRGARAHPR